MPLVTLSADSPLQEILDIMKRDGGISKIASLLRLHIRRLAFSSLPVIKDFANPELLKELNTGFDPLVEGVETPAERDALDKELGEGFSAPNTIRIYGLLGKMPGPISKVIMHPGMSAYFALRSRLTRTFSLGWHYERILERLCDALRWR